MPAIIWEDLPLENKIEPVSNNSHPYHLGANIMAEMKPEREIDIENITRVTHYWHKAEEAVVFSVVVLQMLYN